MSGNGKRRIGSGLSGAMGTALLMGLAAPFLVIPAYAIIFRGGVWWIPMLFGYLSLFFIAIGYLFSQKAMIEERAQIGEEMFYRNYPNEMRRELRLVRKNTPDSVARVLREFRETSPQPLYDEKWEEREKQRRRGTALYQAAGIVSALIVVYLITAVILDGTKGRFDVPQIMTMITAVLLIAQAVPLFQNRNMPLLSLAAGLMLFIATWARMTLILKSGYPLLESRFLEFAFWTVLFVITVFVLPRQGEKCLAVADAPDRDRQLQLELFELGAISEDELRYRMKQYY